jgi:hypothetical protein
MSDETPADADERSVQVPEAPSLALSKGEVRSEKMEQDQPDRESGSTADESGPAETDSTPHP